MASVGNGSAFRRSYCHSYDWASPSGQLSNTAPRLGRARVRRSHGGLRIHDIVIDPACFLGLVTSAVEAYNRETNGFLIGADRPRKLRRAPREVAVLKAAYPLQTAERKVNWVANGNGRAFDRARQTVTNAYRGLDLLGGFHSHTGPDAHAGLSGLDMDYIEGELSAINRGHPEPVQRRWLELVLAIRRREYAVPHALRWTLQRYDRKLRARVALRPDLGYDITMGGFLVFCEKNGRPRTIELSGTEEARLHAPWFPVH